MKKGFAHLIILVAAAAIVVAAIAYLKLKATGQIAVPPIQQGCTLEAKICPDGSSVGRTGPNCEFTECPPAATPYVNEISKLIALPSHEGWLVEESFNSVDELKIKKDNYEIRIAERYEGSLCVFPDTPDTDGPVDYYSSYYSLNTSYGSFRIGKVKNTYDENIEMYRACSKDQPDDLYQVGTTIGTITYLVPSNTPENIIREMNEIVKNIKIK